LQQQFAIGVNDVTRVLERMPAAAASHSTHSSSEAQSVPGHRRAPLVPLQVTFSLLICYWGASVNNLPKKLQKLSTENENCCSIICIYHVKEHGFLIVTHMGIIVFSMQFSFSEEKDTGV
jgi:hypothetical protein